MHTKKLPTYLSITDAAEVMSVSTKTIRRRISDGTIPACPCVLIHLVILLDELEVALQRTPTAGW